MSFGISLFVLLMTLGHARSEKRQTTIVDTPRGPINGLKTVNLKTGKELFEFRGIPYAKALRFKQPEPVEKWTDILDATEYGAGCPQRVLEVMKGMSPSKMSEDCLFLNIYVPGGLVRDEKLNVMVWIHGGGMQIGFSNQYNGGWIATEGNVIVVTLNYRLNIFGFLALNHPASKGNYGLWDQQMALQWVQENINSFGGDPHSVTIFGESAGGWSTSIHSLLPSNKGLFNRVIAQSGVVGPSTFLTKKMIDDTILDLANRTVCPTIDMFQFVDCLREKPMEELVKATDNMVNMPKDRLLFNTHYQQVIDGNLIRENPIHRLMDKNSEEYIFFNSLDFLTGTTSNEGALLYMVITPQMQEYYGFNVSEGIPSNFVRQGMVDSYVKTFYNKNPEIKAKIYDFYQSGDVSEQSLLATYLMSDIWFNFPTIKMLEFHLSGKAKTFQYVFSKPSAQPLFGQPPAWCNGVGHAEELQYLFDIGKFLPSLNNQKLSSEDKTFAKRIIQYWTSFAKTGQPNGGMDSVTWKQYESEMRSYLEIDVKDTIKTDWNQKMYQFWSSLPSVQTDPANMQRDEL